MTRAIVPEGTRRVRRRYQVTFLSAMGIYCVAVAAISGWLGWEPPQAGFGLYLSAMSPAFPVGVAIFALIRYLHEEPDEFFRMVQVQSTLVGFGLTMFTCTAWGFLAQYAHVWAPPLYLVFPMWAFWLGLVMPLVKLRYR